MRGFRPKIRSGRKSIVIIRVLCRIGEMFSTELLGPSFLGDVRQELCVQQNTRRLFASSLVIDSIEMGRERIVR